MSIQLQEEDQHKETTVVDWSAEIQKHQEVIEELKRQQALSLNSTEMAYAAGLDASPMLRHEPPVGQEEAGRHIMEGNLIDGDFDPLKSLHHEDISSSVEKVGLIQKKINEKLKEMSPEDAKTALSDRAVMVPFITSYTLGCTAIVMLAIAVARYSNWITSPSILDLIGFLREHVILFTIVPLTLLIIGLFVNKKVVKSLEEKCQKSDASGHKKLLQGLLKKRVTSKKVSRTDA